jgi:antitoxin PrlF
MITSKMSSKAQTTIPMAVRNALRLREGDTIGYQIEAGQVTLVRLNPQVDDDPFALFSEWASDADSKAYAEF